MPEPITGLDPEAIRGRLDEVRARAGPEVEILVATKYVVIEEMGALAEAGVELVGENRLDELEAKRARWGKEFEWDFIGNLQSRKAPALLGEVRTIHSLASASAARRLEGAAEAGTRVLVQVNVAGEKGKGGIDPAGLEELVDTAPCRIEGLSTMPPLADDPEASRPHFARLAELAAGLGLSRLSMGTSQDWGVAVEEGATTIRLGSSLLR